MRNKFDEQLEKLHVELIQMGAADADAGAIAGAARREREKIPAGGVA